MKKDLLRIDITDIAGMASRGTVTILFGVLWLTAVGRIRQRHFRSGSVRRFHAVDADDASSAPNQAPRL